MNPSSEENGDAKEEKSCCDRFEQAQPVDRPDDAPELTDAMLDRAAIREGNRVIRKGRALGSSSKGKKNPCVRA